MRFKEFYKLFLENEISQTEEGYRGGHEAPDPQSGAPMFDLTRNGIYPEDFYQTVSHYIHGEPGENQVVSLIYDVQGNQKRKITVYRAVPKDLNVRIQEGDWVTPSRAYALDHGRTNLRNNFKIIQKTVTSRDLYTGGDSLMEWGYYKTEFDNVYYNNKRREKFLKIIEQLNNGAKLYKINQIPEDPWFENEQGYIDRLNRIMSKF